MNSPTFALNPVALKRWRRFRETRRAWWSLIIIVALYVLSLVAELICNREPLVVHYNGRFYFPVFRFYPETVFTGSGRQTRPDYKAIAGSPEFRKRPDNRMIFPLIPFGPNEIIRPESISIPPGIRLCFTPAPPSGSLNLRADFTVTRSIDADSFIGGNPEENPSLSFTDRWALSPALKDAINLRFLNQQAPFFSEETRELVPPHRMARITLATFTPRTTLPSSIRLSIEEFIPQAVPVEVTLDAALKPQGVLPPLWNECPEEIQNSLLDQAGTRLNHPVDPATVVIQSIPYRVSFEKNDVRWPYPPVEGHWLGIDSAGRDVLARLFYGFRTALTFGIILVVGSMLLGIFIGAVQGYYGGLLDITGQRLIEIWSALPFLYIMILLGAIYGRSFMLLLICYGFFNWIGISYYMRGEFLKLRRQPFVDAARIMGLSDFTIMIRHILPNALVPVITFFPFSLVGAIGALAALDYLGFGLPPPTPSWGDLLQQAQQFRWAWWLILYPSLALFIVMLLGIFIGDGIRQAYDPRRPTRWE